MGEGGGICMGNQVDWLVSLLVGWLVGWFVGLLVGWLVSSIFLNFFTNIYSLTKLIDQSAHKLIDWQMGCLNLCMVCLPPHAQCTLTVHFPQTAWELGSLHYLSHELTQKGKIWFYLSVWSLLKDPDPPTPHKRRRRRCRRGDGRGRGEHLCKSVWLVYSFFAHILIQSYRKNNSETTSENLSAWSLVWGMNQGCI